MTTIKLLKLPFQKRCRHLMNNALNASRSKEDNMNAYHDTNASFQLLHHPRNLLITLVDINVLRAHDDRLPHPCQPLHAVSLAVPLSLSLSLSFSYSVLLCLTLSLSLSVSFSLSLSISVSLPVSFVSLSSLSTMFYASLKLRPEFSSCTTLSPTAR